MVEVATGRRGGAGQPAVAAAVVQTGAIIRVSAALLLHGSEAHETVSKSEMGSEHFHPQPGSRRMPTKVLMTGSE